MCKIVKFALFLDLALVVTVGASTQIINGTDCPVSNVVLVNEGCVQGSPHFDYEGMVCANDGMDDEAYCSYNVSSVACAYCKVTLPDDDLALEIIDINSMNATTGEFSVELLEGKGGNVSLSLFALNESATPSNTVCSESAGLLVADNLQVQGKHVLDDGTKSEHVLRNVKINMTDVQKANVYHNTSETAGELFFCVRADMSVGDIDKALFAETMVTIVFDLTADFALLPVEIIRTSPTTQDAEATFQIGACICENSANTSCIDSVLTQNAAYNICLTAPTGMRIANVSQIDIMQDDETKHSPIADSQNDILTSVSNINDGNGKIVSTRVLSSFFESTEPSDLDIVGSVLLDFISSSRHLEENIFETKREEDDTPLGSFELSIGLEPISDADEKEQEKNKDDIDVNKAEEDNSNEEDNVNNNNAGGVFVNVTIVVVGAALCASIIAVGLRRSHSQSGSVKYEDVRASV